MSKIDYLFFELIRVSLGVCGCLSKNPTTEEWKTLYNMAKKQSLVGVCFAGLQRLKQLDDPINHESYTINLEKQQYLAWLAMAAKIQQRNDIVCEQCVELQAKLSADGFASCVLKGQSVASLYGSLLSSLRQSGDIDMWMVAEPEEVIEWARATGAMFYYDYHHVDLSLFYDTEIELHYRPSISRNLVRNARLQKWFKEEGKKHIMNRGELGFAVPNYTFNVVLTLNHNFWHLLYEGVGFRQTMDLYFVLKSRNYANVLSRESVPKGRVNDDDNLSNTLNLLKHLKLERFTSANMWIMKEVFYLDDEYLLCEPNEKLGRHLLEEIMQAGNFGHFDERLKNGRYDSRVNLMWVWMKHNFRLFMDYPADVLWTPLGILRISLWRRMHYKKENELKNIK